MNKSQDVMLQIPLSVLNEVTKYLSEKPYKEVSGLLEKVKKNISVVTKEKKETENKVSSIDNKKPRGKSSKKEKQDEKDVE